MKALKCIVCICITVALSWSGAHAQNSKDTMPHVRIMKDTMLHVVKSFQPTIADAYKINDMPVVKDSVPPPPQLSYGINSKKVFTPFTVTPLKSAKMIGEPLSKLYSTL